MPTDAPPGRPGHCPRTTRGVHPLLTVVQMPPATARHAEYVGLHVYAWE
ncbi:hypothetical protein [Kineosporia mesophila]|nr:hypothetical protein [Kineosporia mesophila]MCD5354263.1 hypothetical protein [Kineosporia mesophila]